MIKQENYINIKCPICKNLFKILKTLYKYKKNNNQKTFCCSVSCSLKATREIRSISQRGKPKSEQQKQKLKENAKINPDYGMRGKHHKPESCDNISKNSIGKILSIETIEKIRQSKVGENHPNYIDGRSYLPYCNKFDNKFKEEVRTRDNNTCQLCNKIQLENGRKLDVHHIHGDKSNCYPDCITLCHYCNFVKVEKKDNRKYYESLFMNKLNERGLLLWSKHRNK